VRALRQYINLAELQASLRRNSSIVLLSRCNVWQARRKAETTQGEAGSRSTGLCTDSAQAAKKEKKEDDEDTVALKQKQKAEADLLKAAREKGGSIYRSWGVLDGLF
jgi:hypothetical protein